MAGFNRLQACQRIAELIREANLSTAPDFVVMARFAPRDLKSEAVWLGDITGDSEVSGLRSGRKYYNTTTVIPVHVGVSGSGRHKTVEEACQRAQDLAESVHDVIASAPCLQQSGSVDALPGVYAAVVSWTNGPDPLDAEFPAAACTLTVTINSRNT